MEELINNLNESLNKMKEIRIIKTGISKLSLLGIALVVLNATGHISISWVLALAPFWVPVALKLCFLIPMLGVFGILLKKLPQLIDEVEETEEVKPESTTVKKKNFRKKSKDDKAKGTDSGTKEPVNS